MRRFGCCLGHVALSLRVAPHCVVARADGGATTPRKGSMVVEQAHVGLARVEKRGAAGEVLHDDAAWTPRGAEHYDVARFWTELGEEDRHCSAMVLDWVRPDFMHTVECGGKRSVRSIWAAACAMLDGMARAAARRGSEQRAQDEGSRWQASLESRCASCFSILRRSANAMRGSAPPSWRNCWPWTRVVATSGRAIKAAGLDGSWQTKGNDYDVTCASQRGSCTGSVATRRCGACARCTLGSRLSPKLDLRCDWAVCEQFKLCGRTHPI